jgi:hypothetical protein
MNRVKVHELFQKIIGDKGPTFKQLIIRNHEPPKHPLHTGAASQTPLPNPFGM